MNFTVFNSSGKILRSGSCADQDVALQAQEPGEYVISAESNPYAHYVDVETKNIVGIPNRPSDRHVFDYTIKQWVDPRTPETEWPLVRIERYKLLLATDWTQLPDVPLATKEAWATYRQALRDITNQPDPFNIVWPVPPG